MKKIFTLLLAFGTLITSDAQTYHPLAGSPFYQGWDNTNMITTDDTWSGVPSIIGFRGDDITALTGQNPDTLLGLGTVTIDVIANQTNPNTLTAGGVAEFEIANPTIALQGSGTADAPYITVYLNTTGVNNINFSFLARDIDGSSDNAIQSIAVQYRVGNTGSFINIPAGFIADASTGPNLATQETYREFILPAAANNQAMVEVRIITTNALGSDEWIGIDNISVHTGPLPLSLTSFKAFLNSNNVELKWASTNEENVKSFTIERSADGRTFTQVGELAANNAATAVYSFTDNNATVGVNYYRIKMTDKDGTIKYSSVITISNRSGLNVSVFPNPTFGNVTVSHAKANRGAILRILNAEGRQIKTYAIEAGAVQTSLTVSELVKGNYVVVFENNGDKSTSKFVKQ